MASESSKSSSPSSSLPSPSLGNNVGDTFIGSSISLISKYEIRYEGILYHLNVGDSTLGLKNVRSCGTEGRKKDGPQIPPSDRVYDYILFRGSDIKDLQVISSRQEIQSEKVINQSSQSMPAMSSPVSGYDSGYGLGRGAQWVHTPALSSKPVPATQHSLVPLSFQSPSANAGSLRESSASLIGSTTTSQAAQNNAGPPMLIPSFMQEDKLAPTGVPLGMMHHAVSSSTTVHNDMKIIDPFASPVMGLVDDTSQVVTPIPDIASKQSYSNLSPLGQAQLHTPPVLASSPSNLSPISEAQLSAPNVFYDSRSAHPYQTIPYELPAPLIPGPILNSPQSFSGMDPLLQSRQQMVNRGQEMFAATNPVSGDMSSRNLATTNQSPLLPLPVSAHQSWFPSSSNEFSEEFDFEAMNEKFKKSELWGFLGKNNQNDYSEDTRVEPSAEGKAKPAYNKDDFFDTISCNQLQQQHNQFPEHMRQNSEVFGNGYQRPPLLQPGQGAYLTAQTNYNNNYSNSGYGYYYGGGRGRGRNTHF